MKSFFGSVLLLIVAIVATAGIVLSSPPDIMEFGMDAVIDQDGNMYISDGDIYGLNDHVFVTSKYNKEGRKLWEERYGPEGGFGFCKAITADRAKNIYVTGVMREGKREKNSSVSATLNITLMASCYGRNVITSPRKTVLCPLI